MKRKTKYIFAALVSLALVSGFVYHTLNDKKAYDYSKYYKEVKLSDEKENNTDTKDEEGPEKVLSLSLLKQANPDVVGILEFDDRIIYEPIVQAPDNDYYVRKNIDLNYAAAGIPFVSFDSSIYAKNVVVYGHSSTRNNIIFTPLMNYLDKSFYEEHSEFLFETENEVRTYKIFSVFGFDTKDLYDSMEFTQSIWRKETEFEKFIVESKEKSIYQTNVGVSSSDKIMTLVTCDTRDSTKRVVVLAKLVSCNSI